jgi:hypothetical protein
MLERVLKREFFSSPYFILFFSSFLDHILTKPICHLTLYNIYIFCSSSLMAKNSTLKVDKRDDGVKTMISYI